MTDSRKERRQKKFKIQLTMAFATLIIGVSLLYFLSIYKSETNPPIRQVKVSKKEKSKEKTKQTKDSTINIPKATTQEKTTTKQIILNDQDLMKSAENVYYGVYYFNSESTASSNNSKQTPSASIIKIFIMDYVFSIANSENNLLDEAIDGVPIFILVQKMIQTSDNQATNQLISRFGMAELNNYFSENDYHDTKIERNMLDEVARNNGLDNYTSLDDTMRLLKKMYTQRNEPGYQKMIEILKGQTIKSKIPKLLPPEIEIANKTGELSDVENDMGIVFIPQNPFAIVVLTQGVTSPAQTQNAIALFAQSAYNQAMKIETTK